ALGSSSGRARRREGRSRAARRCSRAPGAATADRRARARGRSRRPRATSRAPHRCGRRHGRSPRRRRRKDTRRRAATRRRVRARDAPVRCGRRTGAPDWEGKTPRESRGRKAVAQVCTTRVAAPSAGGSGAPKAPTIARPATPPIAMAVHLAPPDPRALFPVAGVALGTAMAGVRKANRRDVLVVTIDPGAAVAGVFTSNRFCAAPVQLCREHLAAGNEVRALLVNTGNANAGTGADGLARARSTCDALARLVGCGAEQVLPFSTGVIMETLPHERIEAALPTALDAARPDAWAEAAEAIMTTDTVAKAASTRLEIGGQAVAVTGISKGAGMIRPDMATMLGFVATDAKVAPALMQRLVRDA